MVIPVHQIMPQALAEILQKAPLTPEKLAFAWRSAVGAAVANATTIDLRGGVLRVSAKDAAWQREIERSAAIVRGRLEALLGTSVVRYIDVTVAPATPAAPETPAATGPAAAAPARGSRRSAGGSGTARRRR